MNPTTAHAAETVRAVETDDLPGSLALAQAVSKGEWPHTMDAQVWAKEFNSTLVKLGHQPFDTGWLIGWFANAIMAGYDTAQSRALPTAAPSRSVSTEGQLEAERVKDSDLLLLAAIVAENPDARAALDQVTSQVKELERWKKAYRDMELLAADQCLELSLLKTSAAAQPAERIEHRAETPRELAIFEVCPISRVPVTEYEINTVNRLTRFAEHVLASRAAPIADEAREHAMRILDHWLVDGLTETFWHEDNAAVAWLRSVAAQDAKVMP